MASAYDEARRRAAASKARVMQRIADQKSGSDSSAKSIYDSVRNRTSEDEAARAGIDTSLRAANPDLFNPTKQLQSAIKTTTPTVPDAPSFQQQIKNIGTVNERLAAPAKERQDRAQDSLLTEIGKAGGRLISKIGKPLTDLLPEPDKDSIVGQIPQRGSLITQLGDLTQRTQIPYVTDDSAIPSFLRGVGDTASLGTSTYLDRMMGNGERADAGTRSTAGNIGQVVGDFLLPAGKLKAGAGLVKNILHAGLNGGVLGALGELGETLTNRNDQSYWGRLGDIGLGAAAGGVGGGAVYGLGKGIQKIVEKYRPSISPEVAAKVDDLLALPAPRERGNVNTAETPDVITPDYTFKLPDASPKTAGKAANAAEARADLKEIEDNLRQVKAGYDRAVTEEYQHLKANMSKGVQQGNIIKDAEGNVTGRFGRQSNNDQWYRDFFAENGRKPNNKELYVLAKKRVDEGFQDEQGAVPSWRQHTGYDDTVAALEHVRDVVKGSIRELDPAIHVTDSALVSKELAFGKAAEAATPAPKAAEPAPKATTAKRKPLKTAVKPKATAAEAPKSPPKESPKTDEQPKAKAPEASEKPKSGSETKKDANVRANFGTQKESGKFSEETNKGINDSDHTYEPKTNKETVDDVNELMKDVGKAEEHFHSDSYIREGNNANHTALGYRLMQEFDAKGDYNKAISISKKLAADLTKQGQGIQAANIIHKLSPEGQLMALTRRAEDSGIDLKPEDRKAFKEAAELAKESANPALRNNAVQDVLDKLEEGQEPSESDLMLLKDAIKRAKKLGIETAAEVPKPKPKLETKVRPEKPKEPEKTIPETEKPAPTKREKALNYMQKQEDAAWKRIQERRGLGFTPKGGNEIVDYAIIAANRVAKGVVKASNHVEQLVKMFGEEVRPYASKIFKEAQKQVRDNPDLDETKKTVKSAEELVEQYAKRTSTSHADLKKLRDLAKQVEKLEGKRGRDADIAMQQIMNKYEKSSVADKVQALRYMMMLGNTATQGINITSNIAMAVLKNTTDVGGAMLESILQPVLKKKVNGKWVSRPETTAAFGNNPFVFMADFIKNYGIGAKANWKGVNPAGLHSLDEIQGLAFRSKFNPLHYGEKGLKAVAGGADYAIYKTQFDNELKKQAKLAAKRAKPADKEKFIRDFITKPSDDAIEIADRVARETTFQQQGSVGDVAAKAVAGLGHKGKIGKALEQSVRAVVPFIRTPLNIATTGVNMTPVGILNGTYRLIVAKTPAEQRKAISNLMLGLTGSGMGVLGYYLNKVGIITDGNDSGDKDLDAIREQAGNGAYRFNQSGLMRYLHAMFNGEGSEAAEAAAKYQEGDRTFDYNRMQPVTFPLAVGAGFREGDEEGGAIKGLINAGTQGLGSVASMSALKSLQDAFNTPMSSGATAGDKQLNWANRILESYVKSFSPSILAQQARLEDSTQRQTPYNKGLVTDVKGYYKSRTPSLGGLVPEEYTSKSLPAKKTTLGQDKKNAAGVVGQYLNPYRSEVQNYSQAARIISDLVDKTGDTTIVPKAPPKTISGKDKATGVHGPKTIEPERYAQYQADIGNEITRKILELSPNLSDDAKIKKINSIYDDVTEKYRTRLKREMGISIK